MRHRASKQTQSLKRKHLEKDPVPLLRGAVRHRPQRLEPEPAKLSGQEPASRPSVRKTGANGGPIRRDFERDWQHADPWLGKEGLLPGPVPEPGFCGSFHEDDSSLISLSSQPTLGLTYFYPWNGVKLPKG